MTDPPRRHSTIAPPPDRDRKTDPPLPTDKAPPEIVTLSENVLLRLDGIENELRGINLHLVKLDELHTLLMGAAPEQPGGRPRPSIVSELHQMNTNMNVVGVNTELVAEAVEEQQKTLPELIAEAVANKVVSLYQEEIRALKQADEAMLARIDRLAEVAGIGTNGNGHHK